MVKAVRTDARPECPGIDASLHARGVGPVLLPSGMRPVLVRSLEPRLRAQSAGVIFA